jgi:AP-1 complex subunit mu
MASAVFITDTKGKVIICRDYRGDAPLSCAQKFAAYVQERDEIDQFPVFTEDGITFAYVKCNDLYLMGVSTRNTNVVMFFQFLYRILDTFKKYFGEIREESIRDNFVIIYELLDECMDHGYPQTTDSDILKEFITTESHRSEAPPKPPMALTNAVSWRSEGIKHKKNEIFLDVVEKLNLLVSSNGTVLHSEVLGAVQMRSFLSGMPELKLGLNDKLMYESTGTWFQYLTIRAVHLFTSFATPGNPRSRKGKAVEMEDIKFHQCVRLARFENDRTISFIPPDGEVCFENIQTSISLTRFYKCSSI